MLVEVPPQSCCDAAFTCALVEQIEWPGTGEKTEESYNGDFCTSTGYLRPVPSIICVLQCETAPSKAGGAEHLSSDVKNRDITPEKAVIRLAI